MARLKARASSRSPIEWKFGWEFTLLSDKWYLNDYHVPSQTLSSNYFSETTSSVYLTGQGDRGYFDLRGYYFEGLSSHDFQPQQPVAHPVWDYNKTFDIDPAKIFWHRRAGRTRFQSDQSFGEFGELRSGGASGSGQCLWSL